MDIGLAKVVFWTLVGVKDFKWHEVAGYMVRPTFGLIVMGTHGHGFLFSALIGSTARKMVKQSEIPVLVVRLPEK